MTRGGQLGHGALSAGKTVDAIVNRSPRATAGRDERVTSLSGKDGCSTAMCDPHAATQELARPAEVLRIRRRHPELDQGARELELSGRVLEDPYCLLQCEERLAALGGVRCRTQGSRMHRRRAEAASVDRFRWPPGDR